jgi:hypothetical protein
VRTTESHRERQRLISVCRSTGCPPSLNMALHCDFDRNATIHDQLELVAPDAEHAFSG